MTQLDHEELARRKRILEDAYKFSNYIPDDLRAALEVSLDAGQRELVLQLQLLAIQFGRQLQKRESSNNLTLPKIYTGQEKLIQTQVGVVNKDSEKSKIITVPDAKIDFSKKMH